jgi:hypothetical protein
MDIRGLEASTKLLYSGRKSNWTGQQSSVSNSHFYQAIEPLSQASIVAREINLELVAIFWYKISSSPSKTLHYLPETTVIAAKVCMGLFPTRTSIHH